MSSTMNLKDHEQKSESSSDEDFNPLAQVEHDTSASSESEHDDSAARTSKQRNHSYKKRKQRDAEAELDSGDEATIQERQKKRRRRGKHPPTSTEDDDIAESSDGDGEGGLIKTRSQRRAETKERRPLATLAGAGANVDAIWERMNAPRREDVPPGSVLSDPPAVHNSSRHIKGELNAQAGRILDESDLVTIKRTYEFAGEVKTEERRVSKHSEEARVYLEAQAAKQIGTDTETTDQVQPDAQDHQANVRRPLRRVSRFEANPTGHVRTLPDKLQLRWPRTTDEDGNPLSGMPLSSLDAGAIKPAKAVKAKPADKLTTVDKSRMDWAGFVDKEGIAEELDKYGKAKENYVERNRLLARLDERRGEQGRQARIRSQA